MLRQILSRYPGCYFVFLGSTKEGVADSSQHRITTPSRFRNPARKSSSMLRSANYESFMMNVKNRRNQGYPITCLCAMFALFGLLVVTALRMSSTSPQMAQMSHQDLMATLRSVPATVRFASGFPSTMKGRDRSFLHTTTTRQRLVPRSTGKLKTLLHFHFTSKSTYSNVLSSRDIEH